MCKQKKLKIISALMMISFLVFYPSVSSARDLSENKNIFQKNNFGLSTPRNTKIKRRIRRIYKLNNKEIKALRNRKKRIIKKYLGKKRYKRFRACSRRLL